MGAQTKPETDQEIFARLRKPIDELIEKHSDLGQTDYQRFRLRQLAWQAVDVLARTGNVAHIQEEKDIQRIIRDIKQIGAPEEFVEDSLVLAVSIYRKLETDYPDLLRRYRRGK